MATKKAEQPILREEVAKEYAIPEGVLPIFACCEFGEVDLSKVDLYKAAQLAEKGYLKKLNQ